ncbi:MAG: phasin family protein, partial [Pseudolabrys sp.]
INTMMDSPTKPNPVKPVGSSPTDVTQAFRATGAATAETTTLMKDSYSAAVKGAQDYNTKFIEFARANTEAAFEFVQKLSSVKSPSEFFELSTIHSREQFETLGGQAKELTALAQKITLATAEPLKTGANKTFSQLS